MNIQEIIQEAIINIYNADEYDVRRYSGRGMYGRECFGITCDNHQEALLIFVTECLDIIEQSIDATNQMSFVKEALDILLNYCYDSMGRGEIIYWPNIEEFTFD